MGSLTQAAQSATRVDNAATVCCLLLPLLPLLSLLLSLLLLLLLLCFCCCLLTKWNRYHTTDAGRGRRGGGRGGGRGRSQQQQQQASPAGNDNQKGPSKLMGPIAGPQHIKPHLGIAGPTGKKARGRPDTYHQQLFDSSGRMTVVVLWDALCTSV